MYVILYNIRMIKRSTQMVHTALSEKQLILYKNRSFYSYLKILKDINGFNAYTKSRRVPKRSFKVATKCAILMRIMFQTILFFNNDKYPKKSDSCRQTL